MVAVLDDIALLSCKPQWDRQSGKNGVDLAHLLTV